MVNGTPAYPTLMELRTAGWTIEEIARTYNVDEQAIRSAFTGHFLHGSVADPLPPSVVPATLHTTWPTDSRYVVQSSKVS